MTGEAWLRMRKAGDHHLRWAALAAFMALSPASPAASWTLSPGSDLIGKAQLDVVKEGETLLDVGRRYDLGYNEIVAANPELDPWLPTVGSQVHIPTEYILPSTLREGIVVNLAEMRLYYYVPGSREVMTFPIGIGQEGWDTPVLISTVSAKIKDPAWTVPESIKAEYIAQGLTPPTIVPPGPENPLGQYALRLGNPRYLIHGTNKPFGVGRRVSHGCIRMYPEDIETLYTRVAEGVPVRIINQPYKVGRRDGLLYLEAHEPITPPDDPDALHLPQVMSAIAAVAGSREKHQAKDRATAVANDQRGVPQPVTEVSAVDDLLFNGDGWMLQIGAFSKAQNAVRLASLVQANDLPVTVAARVHDGYCHVLVGPYPAQDSLTAVKVQVANLTGHDGQIVPARRSGMLSFCIP